MGTVEPTLPTTEAKAKPEVEDAAANLEKNIGAKPIKDAPCSNVGITRRESLAAGLPSITGGADDVAARQLSETSVIAGKNKEEDRIRRSSNRKSKVECRGSYKL